LWRAGENNINIRISEFCPCKLQHLLIAIPSTVTISYNNVFQIVVISLVYTSFLFSAIVASISTFSVRSGVVAGKFVFIVSRIAAKGH